MTVRLSLMQLAARRSERADFLNVVAYECPKCAYVTSVLALSAAGHSAAGRRATRLSVNPLPPRIGSPASPGHRADLHRP
jgi:hypothetical protein